MSNFISKNLLKIIKITSLLTLIIVLIVSPEIIVNLGIKLIDNIKLFYKDKSFNYIATTLFIFMLCIVLIKIIFSKLYKRLDLNSASIIKNTYSKGKAKWATKNSIKKNFVRVDYNNNYTAGVIISREAHIYLGKFKLGKTRWLSKEQNKEMDQIWQNQSENGESDEKIIKEIRKKTKSSFLEKLAKLRYITIKDIVLLDNNPVHTLVIGTTRSGKTQSFLLPIIDMFSKIKNKLKKPSFLVTDPKGEAFNNTCNDLIKSGYEVIALNMDNFEYSNSYNPLYVIQQNYENVLRNVGLNLEVTINGFNLILNDEMTNTATNEYLIEDLLTQIDLNTLDIFDVETEFFESIIEYLKASNKKLVVLEDCVKTYNYNQIHKTLIGEQLDSLTEDDVKYINNNRYYYLREFKQNKFKISLEREIKSYDKYFGKVTQEIIAFSKAFIPEPNEKPFFAQTAQRVLNSFIYYTLEECYIESDYNKFNMFNILSNILELQGNRYAQILNKKDKTNFARMCYGNPDTEINEDSMATLMSETSIFNDVGLALLTARNQIDLQIIAEGKKPYAIFIITPDYKDTFNKFVTLFIEQLSIKLSEVADRNAETVDNKKTISKFKKSKGHIVLKNDTDKKVIVTLNKEKDKFELIRDDKCQLTTNDMNVIINELEILKYKPSKKLYKYLEYKEQKLDREFYFLLEEFANIPKLQNLPNKLTVSLGRGMRYLLIIQNKEQLKEVYGEDTMKTIFDNTQNKIYLLAGSKDTRDWFSDEVGSTTKISRSLSGKDIKDTSMTETEEESRLVKQEVLSLNKMCNGYVTSLKKDPMKTKYRPAFQYMQNNKISAKKAFETELLTNLHLKLTVNQIISKSKSGK